MHFALPFCGHGSAQRVGFEFVSIRKPASAQAGPCRWPSRADTQGPGRPAQLHASPTGSVGRGRYLVRAAALAPLADLVAAHLEAAGLAALQRAAARQVAELQRGPSPQLWPGGPTQPLGTQGPRRCQQQAGSPGSCRPFRHRNSPQSRGPLLAARAGQHHRRLALHAGRRGESTCVVRQGPATAQARSSGRPAQSGPGHTGGQGGGHSLLVAAGAAAERRRALAVPPPLPPPDPHERRCTHLPLQPPPVRPGPPQSAPCGQGRRGTGTMGAVGSTCKAARRPAHSQLGLHAMPVAMGAAAGGPLSGACSTPQGWAPLTRRRRRPAAPAAGGGRPASCQWISLETGKSRNRQRRGGMGWMWAPWKIRGAAARRKVRSRPHNRLLRQYRRHAPLLGSPHGGWTSGWVGSHQERAAVT